MKCLQCAKGNPINGIDKRIVSGTMASNSEYPYLVSFRDATTGVHFCSGSILNSRWILTAFCCLMSEFDVIVVGSGDTYKEASHNIYYLFTYYGSVYGAALVSTTTSIIFSNKVQPIVLTPLLPFDGSNVIITGWGINDASATYKLQTLNTTDLKKVIVFLREEKRGMNMTLNPTLDIKEFSDAMINEAVENALEDVLKSTRELGIIVEDLIACYTAIPLIKSPEDEEDVLMDDRMIDRSNGNSIDANQLQNFTSLPIEETDDNDLVDTNSDMRKDLSDISSAGIIDDLIMRSYDDKMADKIFEEGPYVRVTVGNKSKVIKKSSLCWLLEETKNRISTDRLKRFLSKNTERPENDKVLAETEQKSPQRTSKCKRKYKNRKSKEEEEVVKYTCVQSDSSDSSADDTVFKYNDSIDTETFSASDFENEI
ncbi:hypothetical protein RN001_008828 [Aquatica leii]|uniref:Peptidase S1 domain-containing protein n=1 Tax=Aquatica leii TaxID=1421715 RepID=A0AAN7SH33_9COLE|nr:hypothetical protein RN001_008828 [Aquatica leii]